MRKPCKRLHKFTIKQRKLSKEAFILNQISKKFMVLPNQERNTLRWQMINDSLINDSKDVFTPKLLEKSLIMH